MKAPTKETPLDCPIIYRGGQNSVGTSTTEFVWWRRLPSLPPEIQVFADYQTKQVTPPLERWEERIDRVVETFLEDRVDAEKYCKTTFFIVREYLMDPNPESRELTLIKEVIEGSSTQIKPFRIWD